MTQRQRFAGIGGHHSQKAATVEWLTPPATIDALGGWQSFDLDPCAPIYQPYPTARRVYTRLDNGLILPWLGRVWLNPPYSLLLLRRFLARMAAHGRGTALIFARTETEAFFRYVWESASALLFMRGRMNFHLPTGGRALRNSGAPTVLCAYGQDDMDILAAADIDGQFVPLRLARSVLVSVFPTAEEVENPDMTWREVLAAFYAERAGPVHLSDLYRHFARHQKARTNPNYEAKLRQELQRGPYRNVGKGLWEPADHMETA